MDILTEEAREQYLETKSLSGRRWYSQGKTCLTCGTPIVNINRSGLCRNCHKKEGEYKKGESVEHRKLKVIARQFLESLGCNKIVEEYMVGRRERYVNNYVRLDIAGFLGGKIIVVECGGSSQKSLTRKSSYIDKLYILPYGEKLPFLWQAGMGICRACGHRI